MFPSPWLLIDLWYWKSWQHSDLKQHLFNLMCWKIIFPGNQFWLILILFKKKKKSVVFDWKICEVNFFVFLVYAAISFSWGLKRFKDSAYQHIYLKKTTLLYVIRILNFTWPCGHYFMAKNALVWQQLCQQALLSMSLSNVF